MVIGNYADVPRFLHGSRPASVEAITPVERSFAAIFDTGGERIESFKVRITRADGESLILESAPADIAELIWSLDVPPESVVVYAFDARDEVEARALIAAFAAEPVAA